MTHHITTRAVLHEPHLCLMSFNDLRQHPCCSSDCQFTASCCIKDLPTQPATQTSKAII